MVRAFRRRVHQLALRRLMTALRDANGVRDAAARAEPYLPVAADSGPSDCR